MEIEGERLFEEIHQTFPDWLQNAPCESEYQNQFYESNIPLKKNTSASESEFGGSTMQSTETNDRNSDLHQNNLFSHEANCYQEEQHMYYAQQSFMGDTQYFQESCETLSYPTYNDNAIEIESEESHYPFHTPSAESVIESSTETSDSNTQTLAKSTQNARKNLPILIQNIVISRLKELFEGCGFHPRRNYLKDLIVQHLPTGEKQQDFLQYLGSFKSGNNKTWVAMLNSLQGKDHFKNCVLLKCIESFLSEEGADDFNHWINSEKKKSNKTKEALENGKEWFIGKMQEKYPYQGTLNQSVFSFMATNSNSISFN